MVRLSDGRVVLDSSGKQSGRGAYVCRKNQCWQDALTRRSVEHALKTTLGDDEWAELVSFAGSIEEPQGVSDEQAST